MDSMRWGILSTAKIGLNKVIPALQKSKFGEVSAISSRSKSRARSAADELGIAKAYGSYEDLLADENIDAVYNPLPNHLHVPWSIKTLEAGKHVLCEKPIGLSVDEAKKLAREAQHHASLKVMEAFMYRFHPQWKEAKALVLKGHIGALRAICSVFSYYNDDPEDIRNQADIGGGGLMDIGCYNISLSRYIFDAEPNRVVSQIEFDPDFGIDRRASVILEFEDGASTFTCATQLARNQGVTIYGSDGRIEIKTPFTMPPDQPATIWLHANGDKEEITIDPAGQYTLQGDAFARAIINDTKVPYPLKDAINNMKVIEAIFESAKKRAWVNC